MLSLLALDRLDSAGIAYCHFKSNEHLGAGLRGETDLDVLVAPDQLRATGAILASLGFQRFKPHPSRVVAGIDDWIVHDPSAAGLIHIHLHSRLPIGPKYLKDGSLPWTMHMLSTRARSVDYPVWISHPAGEMALLLTREATRRTYRPLRASHARTSNDFEREYEWLAARTTPMQVCEWLFATGVSQELAARLESAALHPTAAALSDVAKLLHPYLGANRQYGSLSSFFRARVRAARQFRSKVDRRFGLSSRPLRRGFEATGYAVAILGSDGSGKSTLTTELVRHFGRKIDVKRIYFGAGAGRSSFLRAPLNVLRDLRHRSSISKSSRRQRVTLFKVIFALVLAREKRAKLRDLKRARENGMLVLCDRFPQSQIPGINDGPLLDSWVNSNSMLKQAVARWEQTAYHECAEATLDLIIRLRVAPPTAKARRPEADLTDLERRVAVIDALKFNAPVIDIDANSSQREVFRLAASAIWERVGRCS